MVIIYLQYDIITLQVSNWSVMKMNLWIFKIGATIYIIMTMIFVYIIAVDIANVGGGRKIANESHSNLAARQPISNNPSPSQTNNQNATLTKSNNHINVHHHNHSHINTSLGHKSPAFVVKPSIFPFLNRLWIETRTNIYIQLYILINGLFHFIPSWNTKIWNIVLLQN